MNVLFRLGQAFTVEGRPIRDAGLWVKDDVIQDIGPWEKVLARSSARQKKDFSDFVVTPGLVNCHAHLELTALRGKVPYRGHFLDWGQRIMAARRDWTKARHKDSAKEGLAELIKGGCTTVADYSSEGVSFNILSSSKIRGIGYYEMLQYDKSKINETKNKAKKFLQQKSKSQRWQKGLAVHAPYSVQRDLMAWAFKQKCPRSIHLSELKEELEFLEKESPKNIFRAFHLSLGRECRPVKKTPVAYVKSLGAKNFTAVHLNYLRPGDIEALASIKAKAIFCPLSYKFFKHKAHPFLKLRRSGLVMGLGTDSCASNKHCDMRYEMAALKKLFPRLKLEDVLQMATLGGARALGLEKQIGSLKKGKKADVAFFKFKRNNEKVLEKIVTKCPEVAALLCDGKWVKKSESI